jgi:hypothetical protein
MVLEGTANGGNRSTGVRKMQEKYCLLSARTVKNIDPERK